MLSGMQYAAREKRGVRFLWQIVASAPFESVERPGEIPLASGQARVDFCDVYLLLSDARD